MSAARDGQVTHPTPTQVSTSIAQNLSSVYPHRAAWRIAGSLRVRQVTAFGQCLGTVPQDFLMVVTPGADKTTFALRVATELPSSEDVHKVTIVCSTEHLKYQWAEAVARVGIHIDSSCSSSQGTLGSHLDDIALTHVQVIANANLHHARTNQVRTLVIPDEIHHGGDTLGQGDAIQEAFTSTQGRLALTGTPFRSDAFPIPFVHYRRDASGTRRLQAGYPYGYSDTLCGGVVRPVMLISYSGQMQWRTKAGDEVTTRLGELLTKDLESQA